MKDTEQLINEYVEHECSLMHEDRTILTLEREIRARRIRLARFKGMVNKEKENLRSTLNNEQRKEVHQRVVNRLRKNVGVVFNEFELRAKIGDGSWLLEPIEPADVLFDFGPYEKPNVAITYPWENRPAIIINIVKSIQLEY